MNINDILAKLTEIECSAAKEEVKSVIAKTYNTVAESYDNEDDIDDSYNELCDGCYVRDSQEGENGEVFIMKGDPEDRRVWIADAQGRGWYISPSRLVLVNDDDPGIEEYFGNSNNNDDDDDEFDPWSSNNALKEDKDATFSAIMSRVELSRPDLLTEFGAEYVSQVASRIAEEHASKNTPLDQLVKILVKELMKPIAESVEPSADKDGAGEKLEYNEELLPGDLVVLKYKNKKNGKEGSIEIIIHNRRTVADVIDDFQRDHGDHYTADVYEYSLNEYGSIEGNSPAVSPQQPQPVQQNTQPTQPQASQPGMRQTTPQSGVSADQIAAALKNIK